MKSLSTELDDVYHGYDSLISMNIKLEENIKSLQQYILELYKEIHLSNPFEERKAETSLELQEMESPKELLLSSDITHNLGDITQYSFSPHMITLFEETYRTLESSAELRLQKRDSLHVSESRNSTRIIQEESELNEQLQKDNIEDDETLSKNSLFGKMLNLDPSSLLESLRNNTNPSNQPSGLFHFSLFMS